MADQSIDVGDDEDEETTKFSAIKCGLKTILRPEYAPIVTQMLYERSLQMTEVASLASLLILFKVNEALDNDNRQFFLRQDPHKFIIECFNAVLAKNVNAIRTHYPISQEFRAMVETFSREEPFEWPGHEKLGNGLNYFYKQYTTNLKTNLKTWCEVRLEAFFRMRCWYRNRNNNVMRFDGIDIRNATKFAYEFYNLMGDNDQRIEKTNILLTDLAAIGWSGIIRMKEFVKTHWFESLWLFGQVQRQIEVYHSDAEQWNIIYEIFHDNPNFLEPTNNRPPKVNSFALVPLCDYHLKSVRLDITDLYYRLASKLKVVPRFLNPMTNRFKKYSLEYYQHIDPAGLWNLLFDVDKINQMGKQSKQFHFQIVTNSVSVSVLYTKPNQTHNENVQQQPNDLVGKKYVIGIDPNEKTWLAIVRRNIRKTPDEPIVEENIKIPNPRFHWETHQKRRDKDAKKLAGWFDIAEKNHLKGYPLRPPSPRNSTWKSYIEYRIKMLRQGMAAYSTREYARLDLDHYIQSNKVNDQIAVKVTNNKPSTIFFGASEMPANRPFGIKRRKRCPGARKFLISVKKLGHSVVIMEDEWGTSQTCANCQERFPANTRTHRFKVCFDCEARSIPGLPDSVAGLPDIIVTTIGKRDLQRERAIIKQRVVNGNYEDVDEILRNGRLMSKVKVIYKNWPLNAEDEDAAPQNVVWHRDIVAAKNIMLKGLCRMFGVPVPVSMRRPPENAVNGNNVN